MECESWESFLCLCCSSNLYFISFTMDILYNAHYWQHSNKRTSIYLFSHPDERGSHFFCSHCVSNSQIPYFWLLCFPMWKNLDNVENLLYGAFLCPSSGSDSPISWKKYPFLDIPEGGASAGERKTVITEVKLDNSKRPCREQFSFWNEIPIICYYFYTVIVGMGDGYKYKYEPLLAIY